MKLCPSLALAFAATCTPAFADVIIVPPPVGEQNVIAEAIEGAAPGDTIQLLEGLYPVSDTEQILIDKPLRLLGAGPGLTSINSSGLFAPLAGPNEIEVTGIAAGERVVIQGIEFVIGSSVDQPGAVFVHDCEGVVAILDCELQAAQSNGSSILRVERCAAFHGQAIASTNPALWEVVDSFAQLEDCVVEGVPGVEKPFAVSTGGPGLRADRSGLFLSGSTLLGGGGGGFGPVSGADGPGQPALVLQSSALVAYGAAELIGGDAGTSFFSGARGGPAILADEFSRVRLDAGVVLTGGAGQSGPAPGLQAEPGAFVFEDDRRFLHLSTADPVTADFLELLVRGEPGTPFAIYSAVAPLALPVGLGGIEGLVGLDLAVAIDLFPSSQLLVDGDGETPVFSSLGGVGLETALEVSYQAVEFVPDGTARTSNALLTLFEPQ